ncbi:hypothetical protein CLV40_117127 [Actinokineospora auranticolor]|uniref:Uncharacterized protein n=1 Tax=Actinokineospora auranticolor TaxID=155976 RepID=A0A2S6GI30_9PSEU|nr:hypothetical protein CLV40_117127 [Actinokineospora auranticolor]
MRPRGEWGQARMLRASQGGSEVDQENARAHDTLRKSELPGAVVVAVGELGAREGGCWGRRASGMWSGSCGVERLAVRCGGGVSSRGGSSIGGERCGADLGRAGARMSRAGRPTRIRGGSGERADPRRVEEERGCCGRRARAWPGERDAVGGSCGVERLAGRCGRRRFEVRRWGECCGADLGRTGARMSRAGRPTRTRGGSGERAGPRRVGERLAGRGRGCCGRAPGERDAGGWWALGWQA